MLENDPLGVDINLPVLGIDAPPEMAGGSIADDTIMLE